MIHISYCPFGTFAYNDQGKQVGYVLFKGDFQQQFQRMKLCEKHELSEEEQQLVAKVKQTSPNEEILFEVKKADHKHEFPNVAGKQLRANLEQLAANLNVAKHRQDFQKLMYIASFEQTVSRMTSMNVDDKMVVQAVHAMEEADTILNTMVMRLREWYGFYFPEISAKTGDNEQFAKYVAQETYRKDVKGINVEYSIGSNVSEEDLKAMKQYAEGILTSYQQRKQLEVYIMQSVRKIAPNMNAMVGPHLAAKIISLAGTLEKVAAFPSSTIQIIGAEKALFRYLKGLGSSPKHGIIFQSTFVQQAPPQAKGKVARVLASKLSIASKLDFYKGEFKGDALKADVEKVLQKSKMEPKKQFGDKKKQPFGQKPTNTPPMQQRKPENKPFPQRNEEKKVERVYEGSASDKGLEHGFKETREDNQRKKHGRRF